ncbi:hypothetical protein [Mycobacterium sp.]|uniref:hypothetical protein n=1 Tax=Mycobacterium sp. TaxID=1785 RepID=UPI003BAB1095
MTTDAPQTEPDPGISAAELAHKSGLREHLVQLFIPADTSGSVPVYRAGAVPLAKYVKRLTDIGTPTSAIEAAVNELHNNPGALLQISLAAREAPSRRSRRFSISGVAAAVALIVAGVIGGLIGAASGDSSPPAAAPPTVTMPVTVTAKAPPIDVSVPKLADPVCAKWAPINKKYRAKLSAWLKTDSRVPAKRWSPEQRAVTLAVVPVLNSEAKDLAVLADKASDPVLKVVLRVQAKYISLFASRLPKYAPADRRLWQAGIDFGNAVNSRCYAMAPR